MSESKISRFFRRAGRRITRTWRSMAAKHKERTPFQRSMLGVVLTGFLVGITISASWSVTTRMQSRWQRTPLVEPFTASLPPQEAVLEPQREADEGETTEVGTPAQDSAVEQVAQQPQEHTLDGQSGENVPDDGLPVMVGDRPFHPKVDAVPVSRLESLADQETDRDTARQDATSTVLTNEFAQEPVWPVAGSIVRPFGWYRHPVFGDWRHASSMAIEVDARDRAVRATMAGRVRDVVNEGGVWRLTIEHADGLMSSYEGLVAVDVRSFETVDTGAKVGTAPEPGMGRTVAFSLLSNGEPIDPHGVINGPGLPVLAP